MREQVNGMFKIETYTAELLALLKKTFGDRLLYLGLQGSYLRGEQKESSDIDIMAVIDDLMADDLDLYKDALMKAGSYEKSCGFISGREELAGWNPLEVCNLLHTTKDLYGTLSDYVPDYTLEDEKNFIRLSLGNLYHELCHRYIHGGYEKSAARLPDAGKPVFFILQNLCYVETGIFYNSRAELTSHLEGQDKEVLSALSAMKSGGEADFNYTFRLMLSWCRNVFGRL